MAEITTEMLAGRPMTKRMRLYRKDGSDYWAHLSFQPIRDRLGTFSQWVCVERNISDIVEREEMRSDLMAMIGHDLRNPLQSILGFSELLLEDLAPQAAEYDAVVSDGLKIPTFDGLRIPSP
jgi:signal transduction histidine kinase